MPEIKAGEFDSFKEIVSGKPVPAEPRYQSKWRKHFQPKEQIDIEAWLRGEHKVVGDEAIDQFLEKWEGEPSDMLESAARYLEAQKPGKTK